MLQQSNPFTNFHLCFECDRLREGGVGQFCKIVVSINVIFRLGIYLTIWKRPQALGMSEFKGGVDTGEEWHEDK